MENNNIDKLIEELCSIFVSVKNNKDCLELLKDLCTDKEIEQMAQRIHVARLLLEGNTYSQVMAQSDISSATLSRVSRCVQHGNGYVKFVKTNKVEK